MPLKCTNSYCFLCLGLALNTSTLSARRDSFERNTSAFSPSMDYNSTSAAAAAAAAATASITTRKWPVSSYGALSTMASASPLCAPVTPPPTGKIVKMIDCIGDAITHIPFNYFIQDSVRL